MSYNKLVIPGNPYLPEEAIIVERIQETADLFTLRLKLSNSEHQQSYTFSPGQFNMLYLYGIGEIPISIVSDPEDKSIIDHTIRTVGRVTNALSKLKAGDRIGIRGPFGNGWPVEQSKHQDIVIITGGLGCAPVVSMINYIEQRRTDYAKLNIIQGVKHCCDLLWNERYVRWREMPDTRVLLCADYGKAIWPWHIGPVTDVFNKLEFDANNVIIMMCGPEGMMQVCSEQMLQRSVDASRIYLSMERNMQCATGHCGHCQYGSEFICKDGPVFSYDKLQHLFRKRGF